MVRKVARKSNTARSWKRLLPLIVATCVAALGAYYVIFAKAAGTTYWSYGGSSTVTRTQSGSTYKHTRQFRLSMVNPEPGKTYSVSWTIKVETLGGKTTDATVSPASGTTVLRANGYPDWHQIVPFTITFTKGCYQVYMYFTSSTPNPNTISPQQGQGSTGSLDLCYGYEDPGSGPPQPIPGGEKPGDGDDGEGDGKGPKGTGSGQAPGENPGTGRGGGAGGGGGSSATKQSDKPNPLPISSSQGKSKQTKLEPSPFFDGRLYAPGSDPVDKAFGNLSVGGKRILHGWLYLFGLFLIIAGIAAGYLRWWKRMSSQEKSQWKGRLRIGH